MTDLRTLLPLEEAQARILALAPPLPLEEVEISQAIGRTIGETVRTRRTLPPWDNSAMDGYALRSAEASQPGARLRVVERILAGRRSTRPLQPGECARIMTGAPLPPGADSVVMQERTRVLAEGVVEVDEAVKPRQNIRFAGEDTRAGEVLLSQGHPIGLPEAGLLWAQGLTRVRVPRRPVVAVLSNGDELTPPEDAEGHPDAIVDTNGPSLAAAVTRAGGEARYLGIARDSVPELLTKLASAKDADVWITSAGVSVGEHDFVKEALAQLGVELDFWKVAIKPGKPLVVGRRPKGLVLGLPGNPASSLVGFELFVRPLLRRMLGFQAALPTRVEGRLEVPLQKAAGLTHLVRVQCDWKDGHLWARPLPMQSSGALRSTASASHLLVFPPSETHLAEGASVALVPLTWVA